MTRNTYSEDDATLDLAGAAERLLNTLEFDPLCGATASDDEVLVSIMPSIPPAGGDRFDAVVTCTSRRGYAVAWSTVRVCAVPRDSGMLRAIGPALNRFGQATLRGLKLDEYVVRAYLHVDTFRVQKRIDGPDRLQAGGMLNDMAAPVETWSELPPAILPDRRVTVRRSVSADMVEIVFITQDHSLADASVEFCVMYKDTGELLVNDLIPFEDSDETGIRTRPIRYGLDPDCDLDLLYRLKVTDPALAE